MLKASNLTIFKQIVEFGRDIGILWSAVGLNSRLSQTKDLETDKGNCDNLV